MSARWIVCLLFVSFAAISNSQTLVGSFTVNYRYNTAGCPDADSNAYNPYQCPGLIPPGAIAFDNMPAGQYKLIVTAVGPLGAPGVVIWTGNPATASSSNTGYTYQFATNPQIVGSTTSFTTTDVGTISFFAHDWYPYDNDAGYSSTFNLLSNTPFPAAAISVASGSNQSAAAGAAFGSPLVATVMDAYGNPVPNVSVTFTAPASGAGVTFAGAATSIVQTNALGIATSALPTANGTTGSYSVTASVTGTSILTAFTLKNTPGAVSSIAITSGNNQSTLYNNIFSSPLVVIAKDGNGNLVPNATIAFAAPASGASGTFAGGGATCIVQTNASGVASSPSFTANAIAGTYNVSVSVAGANAQASFSLTNLPGLVITTTTLPNGTAGLNYSFTLTSQNGTGPYNWTISAGTLPQPLTLNLQTGIISGIPASAGTFAFTVKVTDSSTPTPQTALQALSLYLNPPVTAPVTPTFSLTPLPATPTPGATITGGTLQLSQPSSVAYSGTLTLALTADPRVTLTNAPTNYLGDAEFKPSNGSPSTTSSLLVPAATTSPVALPNLDPGTVAGTVTMDLLVGGEVVSTSTTTIPAEAPAITQTPTITPIANGFEVEVIAYSTTRDLSTATFTFTPASGSQISGSSVIAVPVTSTMATWFSGTGLQYGGSFSLTVPFTLSSGSLSDIQSVTVTLTNSINQSAPSAPVTP